MQTRWKYVLPAASIELDIAVDLAEQLLLVATAPEAHRLTRTLEDPRTVDRFEYDAIRAPVLRLGAVAQAITAVLRRLAT